MADAARLDPAGPILGRLARLKKSSELVDIAHSAGITFDLALSERDKYSNFTRIREYLVRLTTVMAGFSEPLRLASLACMARELIRRGSVDESAVALELEHIGWRFEDAQLAPCEPVPVSAQRSTGDHAAGVRSAVVLTALPLETQAVVEHLGQVHEEEHPRGTVYTCGVLTEGTTTWKVAIATAGMGNPAAALEVERAISHFRPEIVLLIGVAGGVKDVKLGDVVAGDKVYAYEKGKSGDTFAPRPESWAAGYAAVQRARQEARKGTWRSRIKGAPPHSAPDAIVKPIAAGEKVIASERAAVCDLIRQTYGDTVAVEMEGAGFLLATHANSGVDALVIRGISDLIVDKALADSAGWQEQAARNAAAFAVEFLLQYRPDSPTVRPADKPGASSLKSTDDRRNSSTYDPDSSTPFFHGRMCDAFPGCEGVCVEQDPRASIERLRVLLEAPLGGDGNSPIWEVGFGTAAIHSFRAEGTDIVHFDHHRYRVRQLVGYRSRTYWHDFVLMYWKADDPTGLYATRSADEISESVQRSGVCREECGVWGDQLITRREYDDGSVFRDGKIYPASAQLQVRHLADGVTFIVAQLSPVNDHRVDLRREALLKEHLARRVSVEDVVEWVESLPRHRRDSY